MTPFAVGHATHPDWRMALALAAAQIDAARAPGAPAATLGFVYFTDAYASEAEALFAALRARWPGLHWVGGVGFGVAASGVEYFDEPALVLMHAALPPQQFAVFSGARPLSGLPGGPPFSALVHADPHTPDLGELVAEMSERVASGWLFGGLTATPDAHLHIADGVWQGGLSGVAFGADVRLVSRVTQGCQPVGPAREVTAADRHVVLELDGRPALPCLLEDLGLDPDTDARAALPHLRGTLAGLADAGQSPFGPFGSSGRFGRGGPRGPFGPDARVRHLVGLEPRHRGVVVADVVRPGMTLAFCRRDAAAAQRDLVRICTEIREEVEAPVPARPHTPPARLHARGDALEAVPGRVLGAIYVSCSGRGGPHFGSPSAELKIVQRALGEVPLAGFFAAGEIARRHLYAYTGVLTVFTGG